MKFSELEYFLLFAMAIAFTLIGALWVSDLRDKEPDKNFYLYHDSSRSGNILIITEPGCGRCIDEWDILPEEDLNITKDSMIA